METNSNKFQTSRIFTLADEQNFIVINHLSVVTICMKYKVLQNNNV